MTRVSVTDLKNRLSEFLRLVKRGETIEVCERQVPIARLVGLSATSAAPPEDRLEWLVREGVVSGPKEGANARKLMKLSPVPCSGDAVRTVVEGRGDR